MNIIETQKLTKYYGKHRGIVDLDLKVKEGDFFGFIGPNGAGKSTTIRLLLGLISPGSGTVSIFGMSPEDRKTEILSQVGYLSSDGAYYSHLKVKELLALSARLRNQDCSKEARILCQRLALDPERKIRELSLGNRKKIGIVCALQHKPKLYIMDEPTSGLDPLMQKEFYDIMKERNEEGATVFLSSHVLSEISRYCKTAAVISDGRILAHSSVEDLVHTGIKRITLRGLKEELNMAGMKDRQWDGNNLNFLYDGDTKKLLAQLSNINFEDINITDPDLEEIFLHYYRKEESK